MAGVTHNITTHTSVKNTRYSICLKIACIFSKFLAVNQLSNAKNEQSRTLPYFTVITWLNKITFCKLLCTIRRPEEILNFRNPSLSAASPNSDFARITLWYRIASSASFLSFLWPWRSSWQKWFPSVALIPRTTSLWDVNASLAWTENSVVILLVVWSASPAGKHWHLVLVCIIKDKDTSFNEHGYDRYIDSKKTEPCRIKYERGSLANPDRIIWECTLDNYLWCNNHFVKIEN